MAQLLLRRRQVLQQLACLSAGASWTGWAALAAPVSGEPLLAAWQEGSEHFVGLLEQQGNSWSTTASLPLPTRPHGVLALHDGSALVVARRPGDWLLRWHPVTGQQSWHWLQGSLRLNGHIMLAPTQPQRVLTTETDQDSGAGLLALRQLDTLAPLDHWPTHGLDPHEMLALPVAVGPWPAHTLLVANGGIPTQAETGRSKKQLDRMEPSLVALDPRTGQLLGQWRLPDQRLSIRHLAWDAESKQVGIALQAEHDGLEQRRSAPVLARWDGQALHLAVGQPALQGYGGSVSAAPGGGFCVSCPKAQGVAWFNANAHWQGWTDWPAACPLWLHQGQLWMGGGSQIGHATSATAAQQLSTPTPAMNRLFDNHWQHWEGAQSA